MKRKPDPRWPEAHIRLKKLYEERVSVSQEEFGAEYGIGTQGMVWQYINGYVPLTPEAAAKFAQGLRCTIKDISPEMDDWLRTWLLPAMGLKAWRRAAAIALVFLLPQLVSPTPAQSATRSDNRVACVLCQIRSLFRYVVCRCFNYTNMAV